MTNIYVLLFCSQKQNGGGDSNFFFFLINLENGGFCVCNYIDAYIQLRQFALNYIIFPNVFSFSDAEYFMVCCSPVKFKNNSLKTYTWPDVIHVVHVLYIRVEYKTLKNVKIVW